MRLIDDMQMGGFVWTLVCDFWESLGSLWVVRVRREEIKVGFLCGEARGRRGPEGSPGHTWMSFRK